MIGLSAKSFLYLCMSQGQSFYGCRFCRGSGTSYCAEFASLGTLSGVNNASGRRHCGRNIGALRDATGVESAEVRGIARAMIEAYLRYLDTAARAGK